MIREIKRAFILKQLKNYSASNNAASMNHFIYGAQQGGSRLVGTKKKRKVIGKK